MSFGLVYPCQHRSVVQGSRDTNVCRSAVYYDFQAAPCGVCILHLLDVRGMPYFNNLESLANQVISIYRVYRFTLYS